MYYPKVEAAPLEFGVAFHKAMEAFYEPSLWANPDHFIIGQGLALVAFRQTCEAQLKKYKRLNGDPDVTVIDEYKERVKLGLNMIRYYTERMSTQYDKGFTPVRVEVPFEVLIKSPQGAPLWCKCDSCWQRFCNGNTIKKIVKSDPSLTWNNLFVNHPELYRTSAWDGLPVTYGGRLDALVQDDIGRYWIVDFKTTSRILDEDAEASFLQLDDQIGSYCWSLREVGIPTAGFIYIEIKKAYPQPPEELSRLYKGRKYSTNKQFLTTYDIFHDHVILYDHDAYATGLYDDHLAWLKAEGPKFHQRHQIHKNDHELDEIGHNIWLEAQDILQNPRVYPQPGRFSCTTCLYRQPCLGVNMGEDYQWTLDTLFERRDRHYWEDGPPSTE